MNRNSFRKVLNSTVAILMSVMLVIACAPNVERLEEKGNVDKLIKALSYEKDATIRADAAIALGWVGDDLAIDPLLDTLSDEDPDVRQATILALEKFGDTDVVEDIIAMLVDDDENVRLTSKEVLADDFGEDSILPLIDNLDTTDPQHQLAIIEVLIEIGEPVIPPLIDALTDSNADRNQGVKEALLALGESAIPSLITSLESDDDDFRQTIIELLVEDGTVTIVPLIEALSSEQENISLSAQKALILLGAEAVDDLIAVLDSEDDKVIALTREALIEIGTPSFKSLVQALADEDRHSTVRGILLEIGEPVIGELIIALDDVELIEFATEVLIHIGKPAMEPLIVALEENPGINQSVANSMIGALRDEDYRIRKNVSEMLVTIGEPAVPALIEVIRENHKIVIGDTTIYATPVLYSPEGNAGGGVVNGGLCTDPGNWKGNVVLCQRGEIYFIEKVLNVQEGGGVAVVIYNSVPDQLIATLSDDNDAEIIVVSVSHEVGDELIENHLRDSARVISEEIYESVPGILIEIGEPAAPYLVQALSDENLYDSVEDILDSFGVSAVAPLISGLDDESEYVRSRAITMLGGIGDSRAIVPILEKLEDSSIMVREEAVFALGKLRSEKAIDPLIELINDEKLQDLIITALGEIGLPAVENLMVIYHDENSTIHPQVIKALREVFTQEQDEIITAAARVCSGETLPNAAEYNRYDQVPHPMVILGEDNTKSYWMDSIPVDWLPFTPEDIQLVVCMKDQTAKIVQTCAYYYTGTGAAAPSKTRYRYEKEVTLFAASTGWQISNYKIRGTVPDYCPMTSSSSSSNSIYGDYVFYADFEKWLTSIGIRLTD